MDFVVGRGRGGSTLSRDLAEVVTVRRRPDQGREPRGRRGEHVLDCCGRRVGPPGSSSGHTSTNVLRPLSLPVSTEGRR